MKTENLTHGSFKAVREVSAIFRAFANKGKVFSLWLGDFGEIQKDSLNNFQRQVQ